MNLIETIFKRRWIIGGILFLFYVIFEIHGSSIGLYTHIFQHQEFRFRTCFFLDGQINYFIFGLI